MSVQVLLALVDMSLFKSMSDEEVRDVTSALVNEIESDPALKRRLSEAVCKSAEEILARKTDTRR